MARVLVVDDDDTVAEVVADYLRRAGISAIRAPDAETALDVDERETCDLALLDLMLPGIDGLELFRRLRARRSGLPVIMLTARGDESDRILGLSLGADDYVAKPFSPRELVLRVQSLLRRVGDSPAAGPLLVDADLVIDAAKHQVTLAGSPVALTGREFDLLSFLVSRPGEAFRRDQLMREVWGWDFGDQSTVTVHVRRLRSKIEAEPSDPVRLVTVWGVGYRWDAVP
jgi:DNA-binding response OmpR family regulator